MTAKALGWAVWAIAVDRIPNPTKASLARTAGGWPRGDVMSEQVDAAVDIRDCPLVAHAEMPWFALALVESVGDFHAYQRPLRGLGAVIAFPRKHATFWRASAVRVKHLLLPERFEVVASFLAERHKVPVDLIERASDDWAPAAQLAEELDLPLVGHTVTGEDIMEALGCMRQLLSTEGGNGVRLLDNTIERAREMLDRPRIAEGLDAAYANLRTQIATLENDPVRRSLLAYALQHIEARGGSFEDFAALGRGEEIDLPLASESVDGIAIEVVLFDLDDVLVDGTEVLTGALELLKEVGRTNRVAICSNIDAQRWAMVENEIADVARLRFLAHQGFIKPTCFDEVIALLGFPAGSLLLLDDDAANVYMARLAGMRAVRVAGVAEARRTLVDAGVLTAQPSPKKGRKATGVGPSAHAEVGPTTAE